MSDVNDETDNLAVWNTACVTDPTATTPGNIGHYKFTSVSGTYVAMRATEVFGPVGFGWGYEILEERYDKGARITEWDAEKQLHVYLQDALTHTIKIELWVKINGEVGKVVQFGHTQYLYKTGKAGADGYVTCDAEAPKKSLTDAMKKCLSLFGIAADVYLGKHDNSEYIRGLQEQAEIEQSDSREDTLLRQRQDYADWQQRMTELMQTSVSLHELEALYVEATRRAKRMDDKEFHRAINSIAKDRRDFFVTQSGEQAVDKAPKAAKPIKGEKK